MATSLGACAGESTTEPDAGPTDDAGAPSVDASVVPELDLGIGETSFTAVEDVEPVPLVRGFQGLQHVWVALRARGLDPDRATIDLDLIRESDGSQGSEDFHARLSMEAAAGGEFAERVGLQLVVLRPAIVVGQDAILRAQVTDRHDVSASAEARVHVVWEEEVAP